MDKKLIERIALEEHADITKVYKQYDVVKFLSRCLARIDAERGKDAVGEIYALNELNDEWASKLPAGTKLFLSPTIPEGMSGKTVIANCSNGESCVQVFFKDHDKALAYSSQLAAAQGERNA